MKAIVIWGTQLSIEHHSALQADKQAPVIMIEALDVCRKHKYHKQKLAFVLTAMREYAAELQSRDEQSGTASWRIQTPIGSYN